MTLTRTTVNHRPLVRIGGGKQRHSITSQQHPTKLLAHMIREMAPASETIHLVLYYHFYLYLTLLKN
jgi:hypothetical protein